MVTAAPVSPACCARVRALPDPAPWLSAGDRVVVAGSRIAIRIDSTGLTEWRGDRLATTVQYFRQ